jgi:hypothetical protein
MINSQRKDNDSLNECHMGKPPMEETQMQYTIDLKMAGTIMCYPHSSGDDLMNKRQMSEWEAKCKQCGLCCHEKIQIGNTVHLLFSACKYLVGGKCSVYDKRFQVKPDCIKLTPENVKRLGWLPSECGLKQ